MSANITEPIKVHIYFIKGPHIHPSYLSVLSLTTFMHLIIRLHVRVTVEINSVSHALFNLILSFITS